MPALVWDTIGERYYQTGIEQAVLYPVDTNGTYTEGIAWSGITSVSESPSGADANKQYADNINYITLYSVEEYSGTIEAFTYPDEWMQCDGSLSPANVPGILIGQQPRKGFGLSYITKIGNDTVGQDLAYKIHLVYGCRASPSDRSFESVNDSPEAITFSWEFTTTPVAVEGYQPTSLLTIDSRMFTDANATKLTDFLKVIHGSDGTGNSDGTTARLPLPDEVIDLLK